MLAVARALGLQLAPGGKAAYSPSGRGPAARSPSISFYERDGVERWKDHGSGEGGDVIDLVKHLRGCEFRDAIDWLLGPEVPAGTPRGRRAAPMAVAPEARVAALDAFLKALGGLSDVGVDYLGMRGLDADLARELRWADLDSRTATRAVQAAAEVVPVADLVSLGLAKPDGKGLKPSLWGGWIVCPFLTGRRRVAHLQFRRIGDGDPKWRHLRGRVPTLFNEQALAADGDVFVVEGCFDAVSLLQRGYDAVGVPGTSWLLGERLGPLLDSPGRLVLGFDSDAPRTSADGQVRRPGPDAQRALAREFAARGRLAVQVQWPEGFFGDWLDWWTVRDAVPVLAEPPAAVDACEQRTSVVVWTVGESPNARYRRVLEVLAGTERWFRSGRSIVYVEPGHGPALVTERNLPGLLASELEIEIRKGAGDKSVSAGYRPLPAADANVFVHHPRLRAELPELVEYTRCPVFDRAWRCVSRPGFHRASGIYYDGPEIEVPSWGPEEIALRLAPLVSGFHWKAPPDAVNFLGACITLLAMPHWWRGNHPLLVVNGNKPRVGKSTLVKALAALIEGRVPREVGWSDGGEELGKQLATRIEAGDRVILIDNVKSHRPLDSAILERCVTGASLSFRRLGSNTAIERPHNDVLFALTMNDTLLVQDLRERSLPINLELHTSARGARYAIGDVVGYALEHRVELVGALLGIVDRWVRAGRPMVPEPARHSVVQEWAAAVDGALRYSSLDGFLGNWTDSEEAFDPDWETMVEIAAEWAGEEGGTPAVWAERLREGPLSHRLKDRRGQPKGARSQAIIVGRLFKSYLDRDLRCTDGGHARLLVERESRASGRSHYRFCRVQTPPPRLVYPSLSQPSDSG